MDSTTEGLGAQLRDVYAYAQTSNDLDLLARVVNAARLALLEIPDAYRDDALMDVAHLETWSDIGAMLRQAEGGVTEGQRARDWGVIRAWPDS